HAPQLPRGRLHDALPRRDARAVPVATAPGPGDEAADVHWRDDHQRLAGGEEERPEDRPHPRGAADVATRGDAEAGAGYARPPPPPRASRVPEVGAGAEAVARDRHHVPRRAPVAPRNADAELRHAPDRTRLWGPARVALLA